MDLHRLINHQFTHLGAMVILIAASLIPAIYAPATGSLEGLPVGAITVSTQAPKPAVITSFLSASRFNQGELSTEWTFIG